ncbi:hypothetical protein BZG02_14720 [Labilibaculum filiforme]|uniref:histidine kinase n=1 Tax=Labilibaculum filiforme TaxID=1940526 RepID=A0A2N3HUY0_9BACT|nr:ABC transporter substrate binding protein [Labilibaculum filiforme]PKQ61875.1 hypothetical protein BZG02_14720 [Labilibaculum filiforme]
MMNSRKKKLKLRSYFILSICFLLLVIVASVSASFMPVLQSEQTNQITNQETDKSTLLTTHKSSKLKNVLILHSYHEGFPWTDRIMKGVNSILGNEDVELFINYMDTKRCADEDYLLQLRDIYKKKYAKFQFDAILSTDDNALNFLLKFGKDLFPDVPVVFCGINDFQKKRIEGETNYTGIYESYDVLGTVRLIQKFHPGIKTIAVINDASVSGNAFLNRVNRIEEELKDSLNFEYLSDLSIDNLHAELAKLPTDAAVIWGIYLRTPNGITLTSEESIQLTSTFTKLPIYCIWDVVGQGVVGGKITSPVFQGEAAAELIVRILNGANPNYIPVTGSPLSYKFDYKLLQQFNIPKSELPINSIVLNEPFSLFKKYRKLIGILSFIIAILIIIVLALMHLIQKINITKKILIKTNENLELAKARAEESDQLKTSFLANLSHEIRTPMNGIIGFTELLDHKSVTIEKQQKYLSLIKSSSQRMLELINNLVDISKLETGQIHCSQDAVDLQKIMNNTYEFFIPFTEKKKLKFTYESQIQEQSLFILTDQNRLEQVLFNLLTNAIKFTKQGEIKLALEKRDKELYFTVTDSGPGIPDDMQEIIFERFRQASHTAFHAEEGSGLGLAISKSLVELMGGTMGVYSELNMGSKFYFTIPFVVAD